MQDWQGTKEGKKHMTALELDNKIENIIKKTVKHYYTDWKNYDRPKYMRLKGEKPEHVLLIVRTCGTYIFSSDELDTNSTARDIYNYFTQQEQSNVYDIQLTKGTIKRIHKGIA